MATKKQANISTTVVVVAMFLSLIAFFYFLVPAEKVATLASPTGITGVVSPPNNTSVAAHTVRSEPRLRYRFSVIPSGVATIEEFRMKVKQDPTLAAHFDGCDLDSLWEYKVPGDQILFMTFRRENIIKWTRRPVLVKDGEKTIIGCGQAILMRCGNEISWTPQNPSEDLPPGTLENPINPPTEAPPIVSTPESAPPYFQPGGPIETTENSGGSGTYFGGFGGGFGPAPSNSVAVPEPSSGLLVLTGLVILICWRRK